MIVNTLLTTRPSFHRAVSASVAPVAAIFEWDGNDTDNPDDPGEAAGVAWVSAVGNNFADAVPNATLVGSMGSYNDGTSPASSEVSDKASRRSGYKGWRQYYGDGDNVGSGAPGIDWDSNHGHAPEYWHRWYMKHQSGFEWTGDAIHYWKMWRDYSPPGDKIVGFGYPGGGNLGVHIENRDDSSYSGSLGEALSPASTWNDIMGGNTGDGLWHLYQYHIKMNSGIAVYDGILEFWVDEVLVGSRDDLNFDSTSTGWVGCFVDNQSAIANGPWYVDWADIKVSVVGYIEPAP